MFEIAAIKDTRIPLVYVDFDSSRATEGLSGLQPFKVLLLGEGTTTQSGPIQLMSELTASDQFGKDSVIHKMAKSYFNGSDIEVWGLGLKSIPSQSLSDDKPRVTSALKAAVEERSIVSRSAEAKFDLEAAFKSLKDLQFNVIACSFNDSSNIKELSDQLKDRCSVRRQLDSYALIVTETNGTNANLLGSGVNSPYISIMSNSQGKSTAAEWSASLAAAFAQSAQSDPARPFQTLELVKINAPTQEQCEERRVREAALRSGVSTYYVDSGKNVRIERLVTTYLTNELGVQDSSMASPNVPLVLSFIRWDMRRYFATKYPRHKLATDKYRGSGPVMTPRLAKAECLCMFRKWEEAGLVQDIDLFLEGLKTEINKSDPNRLDISMSPKFVNQLCILGAKVGFLL